MKIIKYNNYSSINEEFIGGVIKGALGKLSGLFSSTFKDIGNDLKKMFKEDDPNSIRNILLTLVNKAIDSAQKELKNIQDDTALLGVLDNMVNTLTQLANNIGKDIDTAFGKDKKTDAIKEIAKSLLLGNKEADWVGLVGLIDPEKGILKKDINYKFSKKNYINTINKSKDLNSKKNDANKFLDEFQKNIKTELDKDFTEEELKKQFNAIKEKGVASSDVMTYDKIKVFFEKKTPVIYLLMNKKREDWDNLTDDQKKKPNEKPASDIVGVNTISLLDDKDTPDSVKFILKTGGEAKKSYKDIIGPSEDVEEKGENAKKTAEVLGEIKNDEVKMGNVAKFAEFIKNNTNKDKITEIEKIISNQ
jgi:hypothetical protein